MENKEVKEQEAFQKQLKQFKMMLLGSKMALGSSILLIGLSIILMFYSEGNIMIICSLFAGVAALVVFSVKFLSLKGIAQKTYTPMSMPSNISKLKTYLNNRKKYEKYFMIGWIISLVPYASFYLGSSAEAIIGALIAIVFISFFGWLAFKKVDKDLESIESAIQSNLEIQHN